jgi:hypothetical protein
LIRTQLFGVGTIDLHSNVRLSSEVLALSGVSSATSNSDPRQAL